MPTFKKGSDAHKASKFHSAQQMVSNAYEDLQRVPLLEEVKEYSKCSIRCAERSLLGVLFFQLLVLFCLALSYHRDVNIFAYTISLLFCLLFVMLDSKYGLTISFESLFLRKPTDRELKVAIEGIRQLELVENSLIYGSDEAREKQCEIILNNTDEEGQI